MSSEKINILTFYKYVEIEKPEEFKENLLQFCKALGLKGRILIAGEGINGSIAGGAGEVEKFMDSLLGDSRFSDIEFKRSFALNVPFKKMVVQLKKQVLPFEEKVNLDLRGKYLEPEEFLEIYDSTGKLKEGIVLIDNRNDYEWKVGRFKGALKPGVGKFRDFPKIVDRLKGKEDKKVVMYCTGGIRCEKASAYMKQKGFKDVSQLHGGILAFGEKHPDSFWDGKCFVFDKRLLSSINTKEDSYADCELCEGTCDHYYDCKFPECNRFVALCANCFSNMRGCCSDACLTGYEKWLLVKEERNRGKNTVRN